MGLFPSLPLDKFKSGVAPRSPLHRVCLLAEKGDVTRQSKKSSGTWRTSQGYLTFKSNKAVERRLTLQSLQAQSHKEVRILLVVLLLPPASLLAPRQGLLDRSVEPRGCLQLQTQSCGKCLGFLRLHTASWKCCCMRACKCPFLKSAQFRKYFSCKWWFIKKKYFSKKKTHQKKPRTLKFALCSFRIIRDTNKRHQNTVYLSCSVEISDIVCLQRSGKGYPLCENGNLRRQLYN